MKIETVSSSPFHYSSTVTVLIASRFMQCVLRGIICFMYIETEITQFSLLGQWAKTLGCGNIKNCRTN